MSTGDEESEEPENTSPKTVWVKFHKIRNIYYVNLKKTKQLVAITRGCHILFIDPVTEEETIFRAVNAEKGEGVQCMDIARKSKIFAFAEKCMNPRIMVYSIPDLTCLNTLCGGSLNGYLSIAFSEKELLVSLGTYPDFLITIWNWRNGEKLVTQESVLREENQMLKCNFGSVFSVSQMPKHSETLSVWNVHLCYSVCRLVRDDVTLPLSTGSRMCDMLWSPDGILYILEIFGDIFAIEGEQRNVSLAIKWDGVRGHTAPCMAWHKNGIVLAGPDGTIKLYTVVARRRASISKGPAPTGPAWKLVWTAHPKYPFAALCGAEHHGIHELYGFTVRGELYSLSENNLNQVKNFGAGIKDFYFIYPQMDYIVTLNNAGNLMVWYKGTGQMVAGMHLGQNCHNMHASPAAPLLAIGRSDGYIILVSVEKPTEPTIVGELPLCLDDIGLLAFTSSGKHLLAGTKTTGHIFVLKAPPCKNVFVMAYVRLPTQITDAAMFEEGQKNIRVAFIIKTLHCCERGGNEIHIFKCRIHNSAEITKPLKLELIINTGFNYVSITHNHVVPEQLLAIPHRSRHIHVFVLERVESEDGMPTLRPRLKVALASGHQIRSTTVRLARDVVVTWGADGLVVLRCAATLRPLAAITGHHRADGGVARARTDPGATMLLSLGYDGAFVATDMRAPGFDDIEGYPEPAKSEPKEAKSKSKSKSVVSGMFGTENDEEKLTEYVLIGSDRSVNWLQKRKEMKDKEDALQQGTKRKNYQKMLSDVKKQALTLFEANLEGPEEEKLPIGEFDLDDETRRKKIENFNEIMGDMIIRMNAEISARNALAAKIKGRTWDKMIVKTQHIHAFLGQFFVENYAILQPDLELQKALSALEKRMRLTWKTSKKDCFYPWMPKVNYDKVRMGSIAVENGDRKTVDLTGDESVSNIESELLDANNVDVFRGSASHKYVSMSPYHCSQFELSTFHHVHQEVVLLRQITQNLQEYFNNEFKKMLEIKEKELGLLAEKNNRRRHLLSELNISGIPVDDVEWDPLEEPERLMIVKENEVSVPPYLTKSEEELRARKAAEAEALRLALLADDFRERALITMMHGVLELRWEDKIKKDVPKPKCLLEKLPEEWNEEEIRQVRDYDQKVLNLMDQRRLYRKICGKEYEEILQNQKESMLKFDKRLQQLLLLKMEIQSCIDQENLKILRGRMKIHERMKLENQEHSILKEIENTDKEINELQAEIHNLLEAKRNCRHEYDSLLFRERNFDKSFKKEFRDYHGPIASHLYKLYKRRPKVHQKAQMSVSLLEELSRCTMQPGELPSYLPSDCLDFLNALEELDQHSHVPHGASEAAWNSLCKLRRSKIECELKIKAMALQLAECDSTINVFNKTLSILRDKLIMFNKNLKDIREEKLEVIHNVQLQLVMKQGIVEIEDTSDFGNFTDCVLINRSVVEQINSLILEAGDKKLKAMQKVTNFHRVIMCKEWEHKKLRMIIEDLKDKLNYIENVRLTRDLQNLLKMKASGMAVDSGKENMDRQIIAYKQAYDKIIKTTKENLEELNRRVRRAKKSNFHLDKNIIDINVDVNELMLKRDAEQDEEQDKCRRQRMKLIILRGHAVRKIQQQFHEILLLQTELELLRLRTYPTLKYNPIE